MMEILKDIAIGFLVIVVILDLMFIWCALKINKDKED
jgi:hypothetical protein